MITFSLDRFDRLLLEEVRSKREHGPRNQEERLRLKLLEEQECVEAIRYGTPRQSGPPHLTYRITAKGIALLSAART
jgi:hypothetical protein